MLYKDDFGNLHTIGQFGTTTTVSLTANTSSIQELNKNKIYRIASEETIYVVQGDDNTIIATTSDCPVFYNHEEFFNTFSGNNFIAIIAENDCTVFITEMS